MAWPHTRIGSSPRRSFGMGSDKRASMREGPLAALFRKTDEQGTEEREVTDEAPAAKAPASAPAPTPEPEPAAPAAPSELEDHVPHPSLGRDVPEAPAEPKVPVPSPQQRLRAAFSSELPDDILAPPAPAPAKDALVPPPASEPASDPYERVGKRPVPATDGPRTPVLR